MAESRVHQAIDLLKDFTVPPDAAADKIAQLCEEQVRSSSPRRHSISHGDTPGLEAFLWLFWSLLLQAVEQTDSDALHTRVLDVMAQLKTHESPRDWCVWGSAHQIWQDLVLFGPNVRESLNGPSVHAAGKHISSSEWTPGDIDMLTAAELPPDADERAQAFHATGRKWVNLQTFLARAWAAGVYNGAVHALWAMRDALEDEETEDTHPRMSRALAVEATAAWVTHAAKLMFRCKEIFGPNSRADWEANQGAPGRGGRKWDGVDGYDPARWKLWKDEFAMFLREERSHQHVRRAVESALIAMDNAEREM
ncbi:hypothetical protein HDZ31DRAFT_63417 [Schizophyllum fasciatum]